jgi:hypothetical protein
MTAPNYTGSRSFQSAARTEAKDVFLLRSIRVVIILYTVGIFAQAG